MAIYVTYRYVCDFCGKSCRDDHRTECTEGVPLVPAETTKLFGKDACPECLEITKKVLANRAQAVSDVLDAKP